MKAPVIVAALQATVEQVEEEEEEPVDGGGEGRAPPALLPLPLPRSDVAKSIIRRAACK